MIDNKTFYNKKHLCFFAFLLWIPIVFEVNAQTIISFDPSKMQNPNRLCNVLANIGLGSTEGWGASQSTPGGYVCRPLGKSVDIGKVSGGQLPTILNVYVYGGGASKLDRFTLKLNVFNKSTADTGKIALINAANIAATEMGIRLPPDVERLVLNQPTKFLQTVPSGPAHTLFRQQVGTMVVHLEVDQSKITSILIHFRNPMASDLW